MTEQELITVLKGFADQWNQWLEDGGDPFYRIPDDAIADYAKSAIKSQDSIKEAEEG